MRCGHCHNDHDTVAQVALCSKRHNGKVEPRAAELAPQYRKVKPSETRRDLDQLQLLAEINRIGAEIPEGKYAIRNQGGPNDISFYCVERGHPKGRYAGKTFVKQYKSDEEMRLSRQRSLQVLTIIHADTRGAAVLYGKTVGKCSICGRKLTRQESREAGIGPKCAMGQGW